MVKSRWVLCGIITALLLSQMARAADVVFLAQDSQPKYLLHNGQIGGLCGDIYRALEAKLYARGLSVDLPTYYLPIKRIFKHIEEDGSHVFCGANYSKERANRVQFAKQPVYDVNYVLAAHLEETATPKSFQEVLDDNGVVGALYGTHSSRYLKSQLEGRVNDSFSDLDAGLKLLDMAPDRLRYFYYHDLGLNYAIKTQNLSLKVLKTKFKTNSQWLIYSKHLAPEIAAALEESLNELERSGALARIVTHYIY